MNPIVTLLASVSAMALAFGLGGVAGYKMKAGEDAQAVMHQAVKVVRVIEKADAASTAAAVHAQAGQDRVVYLTRTLTKEVHDVLPPQVDVRFAVPVGLVRLHDSAALGLDLSAVPDPAGRADDAASDVAPSRFASAVVANYGDCRADQLRLANLQAWILEQETIHAQH